jgi:hypothetical protein
MLGDGKYAVWFKADLAQGTGLVNLANGRITGGDTVIAYFGSYQQDGDRFRAGGRAAAPALGRISF